VATVSVTLPDIPPRHLAAANAREPQVVEHILRAHLHPARVVGRRDTSRHAQHQPTRADHPLASPPAVAPAAPRPVDPAGWRASHLPAATPYTPVRTVRTRMPTDRPCATRTTPPGAVDRTCAQPPLTPWSGPSEPGCRPVGHPEPDAPRQGPGPARPHPATPSPTAPFKPSRIDPMDREPTAKPAPTAPFKPSRIDPMDREPTAKPAPTAAFTPSRIDPMDREPTTPAPTTPFTPSRIDPMDREPTAKPAPTAPFKPSRIDPMDREPTAKPAPTAPFNAHQAGPTPPTAPARSYPDTPRNRSHPTRPRRLPDYGLAGRPVPPRAPWWIFPARDTGGVPTSPPTPPPTP
jgi:translation initiation factor IF-2